MPSHTEEERRKTRKKRREETGDIKVTVEESRLGFDKLSPDRQREIKEFRIQEEQREGGRKFLRDREKLRGAGVSKPEATRQLGGIEQALLEQRLAPVLKEERSKAEEELARRTEEERQVRLLEPAIEEPTQLTQEDPFLLGAGGTATEITAEDVIAFTPAGFAKKTAVIAAGGLIVKVGRGQTVAVSKKALTKAAAKSTIVTSVLKSSKATLAKALKSSQSFFVAGAGLFAAGKVITIPERLLSGIDAELGQLRESLTIPLTAKNVGAMTTNEALEALDDYQDSVDTYLQTAQIIHIFTKITTLGTDKLGVVKRRAFKISGFIDIAKQQVQLAEIRGEEIDIEAFALIIRDFERG